MQVQTRPVLVVVLMVIMVVMSTFNVEGGGRGIHNQDQRLHHVGNKSVFPSARGVDNHHNIPRQNYDNWGGKGGDAGGDDGTG
ncbi:hypothetical protein Bca4012_031832 [Brassica carinata]|uniref:Uncharacterized protein n=4 Tax=Brassica TaxID=3705 RepID=A0A0D3BYB2_BRAOL|nr:unnamed protein product [Brassica napus]VDD10219.1 unnamed protein product [Brassica oleracea]